jgi:hypothetical protein
MIDGHGLNKKKGVGLIVFMIALVTSLLRIAVPVAV